MLRVGIDKYIDWLERENIDITAVETREELEMLLDAERRGLTEAQLQALWEATGHHWTLEEAGIRWVGIREAWGVKPRYGIQGLPGLWGWETVRTIMIEEGYWE